MDTNPNIPSPGVVTISYIPPKVRSCKAFFDNAKTHLNFFNRINSKINLNINMIRRANSLSYQATVNFPFLIIENVIDEYMNIFGNFC